MELVQDVLTDIILITLYTDHLLSPVAVCDLVFDAVGDDGRVSSVHVGPAERDGVGSHPMNSDSRRSGRDCEGQHYIVMFERIPSQWISLEYFNFTTQLC